MLTLVRRASTCRGFWGRRPHIHRQMPALPTPLTPLSLPIQSDPGRSQNPGNRIYRARFEFVLELFLPQSPVTLIPGHLEMATNAIFTDAPE